MLLMRKQSSQGKRPGAVAIMAAACLAALLAILALSLDAGGLMSERRHAQATADAAALAAAADLFDNYWSHSGEDTPGTARASALGTAKANGYANDGVMSTVQVNIPPSTGPYALRRGYAEVLVQYNQSRAFSNLFQRGPIPVRARAVAIGTPLAADVGILVLDPTAKGALNAQGAGLTLVKDTPVAVNSRDAEAAIVGGGGTMEAEKFLITGGTSVSGGSGGAFIGPVHTGVSPMPDPLADLPAPNPDLMPKASNKQIHETQGEVYLTPGVYRGGISVSGTASLKLAPGIYYMDGGGFSFSGQGSLSGKGVMIYNAPGKGNSDGISISGQGSLLLSGPIAGIYKGVTFFQDRNADVNGNVSGSGGQTDITGTFYFAGALLSVSGNGGVANMGSQYVSRLLDLGGNGQINIQWRPENVAQRRNFYLVE